MNQPYKAYTQATQTVSKTRQVVMLYDGAIRFMQHAIEAIEKKDYETRYHKLTRVGDIIVGLQASLDFESGGSIAPLLYSYYANMDMRLFAIHRSNDIKECEALITQLKQMRDVWDRIDRGDEKSADAALQAAADGSDTVTFSA